MTDLFTPANGQSPLTEGVDYIEYAKTKFKNTEGELDVVALAKGKYESDLVIAQREQELAAQREEMEGRLNLQKLVQDLQTAQVTPESVSPNPDAQVTPQGKTLTEEDIRNKFAELSDEQEQRKVLERNVAFVRDELIKSYGPGFEAKVLARATELGVNKQFLESMAATQPQAFLALVGSPTKERSNDVAPPRTSTIIQGGPSGERNYAFYQKIKASDSRKYWSPSVQLEMHRQAQKLGPSFYSK